MQIRIRRKLEMATRVQEFSRAHLAATGNEGALVTRLEELVAKAEGLAGQERAGRLAVNGAVARRLTLRRTIQQELLRHLVTIGTEAATDNPSVGKQFQLPKINGASAVYLTATRVLLQKAEANRELLVKHGLQEGFLEELGRALDEYESVVTQANAGRRDHVGARAELAVVGEEIGQSVAMLDGLCRYRFRGDSEKLAAWASAKNVVGPVVKRGEPGDGAVEKPAA